MESLILFLMERWWPGDALVRAAIGRFHGQRLAAMGSGGVEAQQARKMALVEKLSASPRAISTDRANEQHYELPPRFFELILGPQLKYSGAYWSPLETPQGFSHSGGEVSSLAQAEENMLALSAQRAQLEDGQRILDLGCGWGSLTLWMARRYPNSRILAVSNSSSQREFILSRLDGLTNVEVLTSDINQLDLPGQEFDRVVSVEMLEHVRNYREVFALLYWALKPGGKLFAHVFGHTQHPYDFDGHGWMERHFFSGGVMPSVDLFLYFTEQFRLEGHWVVDGRHYEKTCDAWLANMRAQRAEIWPILRQVYGAQARRWYLNWQLFFLACSGLFGHAGGQEWVVTHLRWSKPRS